MSEARRRAGLLDIGDCRCRDRIGRLVSFKRHFDGARPETFPLPANISARSGTGAGCESGEIEKATLGLNKRMTSLWLPPRRLGFDAPFDLRCLDPDEPILNGAYLHVGSV